MFKDSKKQGDAGLGQAIAYFTAKGYDVALPLTDSADWDMIVEIDNSLKRVQVKTSSQLKNNGVMLFNANVTGGNKSGDKTNKLIDDQEWDSIMEEIYQTRKIERHNFLCDQIHEPANESFHSLNHGFSG